MGSGQPPTTWEPGGRARALVARNRRGRRPRAAESGDRPGRPATPGCVTLGKARPSLGYLGKVGEPDCAPGQPVALGSGPGGE